SFARAARAWTGREAKFSPRHFQLPDVPFSAPPSPGVSPSYSTAPRPRDGPVGLLPAAPRMLGTIPGSPPLSPRPEGEDALGDRNEDPTDRREAPDASRPIFGSFLFAAESASSSADCAVALSGPSGSSAEAKGADREQWRGDDEGDEMRLDPGRGPGRDDADRIVEWERRRRRERRLARQERRAEKKLMARRKHERIVRDIENLSIRSCAQNELCFEVAFYHGDAGGDAISFSNANRRFRAARPRVQMLDRGGTSEGPSGWKASQAGPSLYPLLLPPLSSTPASRGVVLTPPPADELCRPKEETVSFHSASASPLVAPGDRPCLLSSSWRSAPAPWGAAGSGVLGSGGRGDRPDRGETVSERGVFALLRESGERERRDEPFVPGSRIPENVFIGAQSGVEAPASGAGSDAIGDRGRRDEGDVSSSLDRQLARLPVVLRERRTSSEVRAGNRQSPSSLAEQTYPMLASAALSALGGPGGAGRCMRRHRNQRIFVFSVDDEVDEARLRSVHRQRHLDATGCHVGTVAFLPGVVYRNVGLGRCPQGLLRASSGFKDLTSGGRVPVTFPFDPDVRSRRRMETAGQEPGEACGDEERADHEAVERTAESERQPPGGDQRKHAARWVDVGNTALLGPHTRVPISHALAPVVSIRRKVVLSSKTLRSSDALSKELQKAWESALSQLLFEPLLRCSCETGEIALTGLSPSLSFTKGNTLHLSLSGQILPLVSLSLSPSRLVDERPPGSLTPSVSPLPLSHGMFPATRVSCMTAPRALCGSVLPSALPDPRTPMASGETLSHEFDTAASPHPKGLSSSSTQSLRPHNSPERPSLFATIATCSSSPPQLSPPPAKTSRDPAPKRTHAHACRLSRGVSSASRRHCSGFEGARSPDSLRGEAKGNQAVARGVGERDSKFCLSRDVPRCLLRKVETHGLEFSSKENEAHAECGNGEGPSNPTNDTSAGRDATREAVAPRGAATNSRKVPALAASGSRNEGKAEFNGGALPPCSSEMHAQQSPGGTKPQKRGLYHLMAHLSPFSLHHPRNRQSQAQGSGEGGKRETGMERNGEPQGCGAAPESGDVNGLPCLSPCLSPPSLGEGRESQERFSSLAPSSQTRHPASSSLSPSDIPRPVLPTQDSRHGASCDGGQGASEDMGSLSHNLVPARRAGDGVSTPLVSQRTELGTAAELLDRSASGEGVEGLRRDPQCTERNFSSNRLPGSVCPLVVPGQEAALTGVLQRDANRLLPPQTVLRTFLGRLATEQDSARRVLENPFLEPGDLFKTHASDAVPALLFGKERKHTEARVSRAEDRDGRLDEAWNPWEADRQIGKKTRQIHQDALAEETDVVVTSLPTLPGCRVLRHLGLVSVHLVQDTSAYHSHQELAAALHFAALRAAKARCRAMGGNLLVASLLQWNMVEEERQQSFAVLTFAGDAVLALFRRCDACKGEAE
ncbi:hypothetical protein TGPRC2_233430B, partial [Toxoplasma gondii TgCatPRC2]